MLRAPSGFRLFRLHSQPGPRSGQLALIVRRTLIGVFGIVIFCLSGGSLRRAIRPGRHSNLLRRSRALREHSGTQCGRGCLSFIIHWRGSFARAAFRATLLPSLDKLQLLQLPQGFQLHEFTSRPNPPLNSDPTVGCCGLLRGFGYSVSTRNPAHGRAS